MGLPYRVAVQANTNFRSENVSTREHLCNITVVNAAKLAKLAKEIAPHQCQKYVVCMLALMEKRKMIPRGIAENLACRVQMSSFALGYEATHPAPIPVGITLPSSWPMPPTSSVASGSGRHNYGVATALAKERNAACGQRPSGILMTTMGANDGRLKKKESGYCIVM
jgi:hypothetical protein